jgi:hypothetical protein
MHDFAAAVAKYHQNEQNVESGCRNSEKIDRTLVYMIFQESAPRLRRLCIGRTSGHQVGHGSFGNLKTQLEQFPMNPGRTPARIGRSHLSDKIADFTIDLRPSRTFGFEFPEQFKAFAVPTDNGVRRYNDKRFAPRML